MNLKQSLELAGLGTVREKPESEQMLPATEIARKIFANAEQEGQPFERITAPQWQRKWLASQEFVLREVETRKVAVAGPSRNWNRVLANVRASANAMEPIVVDVNKNGVGATACGFTPSVIVVDGKHRHEARTIQGHGRIMAWVGVKALKYLEGKTKNRNLFGELMSGVEAMSDARAGVPQKVSKVEAAAIISVPRQDRAIDGDRPRAHIPSAFPTLGNGNLDTPSQPITRNIRRGGRQTGLGLKRVGKFGVMDAGGSGAAGASGGGATGGGGPAGSSLGSGGSSNPSRIGVFAQDLDPSDVSQGTAGQEQDPSDTTQTFRDKSPSYQSPGAGVGPRLKPSVGGTKSELKQREVKAGGPGSGCRGDNCGRKGSGTGIPANPANIGVGQSQRRGVPGWKRHDSRISDSDMSPGELRDAIKNAPTPMLRSYLKNIRNQKQRFDAEGKFVKKIVTKDKKKLEAKAPPGWEGTVKHMKKHGEIDNPYALAWYMDEKGDTPHHEMAADNLSTKQRKKLKDSQFVFPDKAPGSGSFPIPDKGHAQAALRLRKHASNPGKIVEKVRKKFPGLGENVRNKGGKNA